MEPDLWIEGETHSWKEREQEREDVFMERERARERDAFMERERERDVFMERERERERDAFMERERQKRERDAFMEREKHAMMEREKHAMMEREKHAMMEREKHAMMEREKHAMMEREKHAMMEREKRAMMEREKRAMMERDRDLFMERERDEFMDRGRDGGPGYDSYDHGGESYQCPPEPWISSLVEPDRGSGYNDRPERSRFDYSEPEQGFRGPPHPAPSWERDDPRGDFGGNAGPTPLIKFLKKRPFPEVHNPERFVDNFFYGGGYSWKNTGLQNKMSQNNGRRPAKKMKTTAENSGNAEELAQITTSDGEEDYGTQEKKEPAQTSSKEPKNEILDETLVNKIQLSCALCKFSTFFEEDWNIHQQRFFHKERLRFVKSRLPDKDASFLEEFLENKVKETKEQRKQIEDLSAKINLIYRNQDLTLGLDIKEFVKKVNVAHCATCNVFIPLDQSVLQSHIKSSEHTQKLVFMKKVSKQTALKTARDILSTRGAHDHMEQYRKGKKNVKKDEKMRSGYSRDSAPKAEESGEMPCITLSDSEGEEEEGCLQGEKPLNDEGDSRSDCGTDLVPETEESQQKPPSALSVSEREKEDIQDQNPIVIDEEEEEEEDTRRDYNAELAPEAEES